MSSNGAEEPPMCPETTEQVKFRIRFFGTSKESSQMVSVSDTEHDKVFKEVCGAAGVSAGQKTEI